jgi:hypothetical protein
VTAGDHATAHATRELLTVLVKLALAPDAADAERWRADAARHHAALRTAKDDPQHTIDIDGLWAQAVKRAEADSAVQVQAALVSLSMPPRCPLTPAALAGDALEIGTLTHDIRQSAATG